MNPRRLQLQLPLRGGKCVFEITDDRFQPFYLRNFLSARWVYGSCGRICSAFLVLHSSACKSPGRWYRTGFFIEDYKTHNQILTFDQPSWLPLLAQHRPIRPDQQGWVGPLYFDLNHLELMRCLKTSCHHQNTQTVRQLGPDCSYHTSDGWNRIMTRLWAETQIINRCAHSLCFLCSEQILCCSPVNGVLHH